MQAVNNDHSNGTQREKQVFVDVAPLQHGDNFELCHKSITTVNSLMVKDPILSHPSLSFLFEELFFFSLGNTVSQISPKLTGTTVPR